MQQASSLLTRRTRHRMVLLVEEKRLTRATYLEAYPMGRATPDQGLLGALHLPVGP
jgi:hypothetical protein